jgi:hypothetical protein
MGQLTQSGRNVARGEAANSRNARGSGPRSVQRAARDALRAAVRSGCDAYDRRRTLPRLLPLDPRELDAEDPAVRRVILARLKSALRAERRRGRAGHWAYDLDRHLALLQAIAGEERGGDAPSQ